MTSKTVTAILLTLLFTSLLSITSSMVMTTDLPVHNVDTSLDYATIQEAIDAHETLDGHTIFVEAGTYCEHVVLNKSVSVFGENKSNTIIDGNGTGNVFYVTADNITITGFTIQNSGSDYPDSGIYFFQSDNNLITSNIITNNLWGIQLLGSGNTIINNTASNNMGGISLVWSSNNILVGNTASNNTYGIDLDHSSNNTLISNTMSNNSYNFGVWGDRFSHFNNYVDTSNTVDDKPIYYLIGVNDTVYDVQTNAGTILLINSNNVTIRDMTLTKNVFGLCFWETTNSKIENITALNNLDGIRLYHSSNNILTGNNVLANNPLGIRLDHSSNNVIYNNNFVNNYQQVYNYLSSNTWDDGYPTGGNYWSDYAGVDLYGGPDQNLTEGIGSDGIGDTSYVIDSNNLDHYPLMIPWTSETLLHPLEGQYANYTIRVTNPSDGTVLDEAQWNLTYHKYVSPFLIYVMSWIDHSYSEWDWTALNITNRYAYHFSWPITGRIGDMWFSGWIETNITTGSTIKLLDGTATVVGDKIVEVNSRPIDCWELLHIEESTIEHTFWYDKTTGLLIGQEAIADSVKVNTTLVDTNIIQLIPPSPTERTEELLETIDTWDLPKGTENSLSSKLKGAIHLLDKGNENGAIHKLMDFINQVDAQRGKKLTDDQADYLTTEAQRIIDLIQE